MSDDYDTELGSTIECFYPPQVYFATTRDQWNSILNGNMVQFDCGNDFDLIKDHPASVSFIEDNDGDEFAIIVFSPIPDEMSYSQIAGLAAHEATHAAHWIWQSINESDPGEEANCYMIQHITQCILDLLHEREMLSKVKLH